MKLNPRLTRQHGTGPGLQAVGLISSVEIETCKLTQGMTIQTLSGFHVLLNGKSVDTFSGFSGTWNNTINFTFNCSKCLLPK